MRRRAELVDETRRRIVEAAIGLHTTVGPANTSIASIADAAGVTRLTVYRHFGDLDAIFDACLRDWSSRNPMPDRAAWSAIPDLPERARRAIDELYRWYSLHADALSPIYRDETALPDRTRDAMWAEAAAVTAAIVGGHTRRGSQGRHLRAAAGHLTGFRTWHSLAIDQRLGEAAAVGVAVRMLLAVAEMEPAALDERVERDRTPAAKPGPAS